MKKKVFGVLLFAALTFSVSTLAFARDIGESLLYLTDLAEANAYKFERMGLNVSIDETLRTFESEQMRMSKLAIEPFSYEVTHCGNYAIMNARALEIPRLTRSSFAYDTQISEADLIFLVEFLVRVSNEGVPLLFEECFYQALREQGLCELFCNALSGRSHEGAIYIELLPGEVMTDADSEDIVFEDISSAYESLIPFSSTHFFSGTPGIGQQLVYLNRPLHFPDRVTYSFTLNGFSNMRSGFLSRNDGNFWMHGSHSSSSGWGSLFLPEHHRQSYFGMMNIGPSGIIHVSGSFTVFR
ncbi:MAG: hypothetical protein FWF79_06010 [Defluviitaleaceae bacterium]|nr:hypothetical protein [Defluviitaleaceae bacterium]